MVGFRLVCWVMFAALRFLVRAFLLAAEHVGRRGALLLADPGGKWFCLKVAWLWCLHQRMNATLAFPCVTAYHVFLLCLRVCVTVNYGDC